MKFALWKYAVHALAHGFGLGLIPFAPGTFGSLLGVILYRVIVTKMAAVSYALLVLLLALAGIFICGQTARDMGATDPGFIVYDEVVGLLVAFYRLPVDIRWIVAGFVGFRVFDLWKPYPIQLAEDQLGLGSAIVADDIIAGIYTLAMLHMLRLVLRKHAG